MHWRDGDAKTRQDCLRVLGLHGKWLGEENAHALVGKKVDRIADMSIECVGRTGGHPCRARKKAHQESGGLFCLECLERRWESNTLIYRLQLLQITFRYSEYAPIYAPK